MSTYIFKKKEKGAKEYISRENQAVLNGDITVKGKFYSMELKLIRSISAEKLKLFSDDDITVKDRFCSI